MRGPMKVKREKSIITGFDFKRRAHLPTTGILFRGEPLTNLPADEAFAYLGVRASLIPPSHHAAGAGQPKRKVELAPCLKAEKEHVLQLKIPQAKSSTTSICCAKWYQQCAWWRPLASDTRPRESPGLMLSCMSCTRSGNRFRGQPGDFPLFTPLPHLCPC